MSSFSRFLWSCLLAVSLTVATAAALIPAQKPVVKLGFYLPSIRDSNLADIKLSLQVWAEELANGLGYSVETSTYQDMAEVRAAVDRGDLQFINAAGMELAETFGPDELLRGYARHQRGVEEGLALVVTRNAGLTTFADLKNKRVSRLRNDRLAEVFLETQCLKAGKRPCQEYVTLNEEKRDIQSVYSVFFGKADAALVNLSTLKTAIDLNPQIANRMKVIQEWKTTALTFGLLTRWADPALTQIMVSGVQDTLKTARGRQMMEIFRTDFIDPVEPSALNPYWALLKEYRALDKTYGAKKK